MLRRTVASFLGVVLVTILIAPAPARAQDDTGWLLGQVNGLRGGLGLHAYALSGQLSAAAAAHSNYMASTCHFSHTESDGSTPQSRAAAQGYVGSWISENIYGGPRAQASDAWNFWINSGVHYEGLTHTRATEIGIGVARGVCGQAYTLVFGHPRGGAAAPPPAAAQEGQPAAVAQVGPQPAPPTARPYVPPPPTNTPTPLIPTLTPSATWTITPTRTTTPTTTAQPPTGTPLVLPTVPALGEQTATPEAVAMLPSATVTLSATPSATDVPPTPSPMPAPELANVGGGFDMRDLLPYALLGQAVVIGLVGFAYFRRLR